MEKRSMKSVLSKCLQLADGFGAEECGRGKGFKSRSEKASPQLSESTSNDPQELESSLI